MRPRIASAEPGGVELVRQAVLPGSVLARHAPRTTRIRRLIRTGALLRRHRPDQARSRRTRPPARRLLLAGTVLTAAGIALPSGMAVIAGMLIVLRGVAVSLGVSEPRRRLTMHRGADFFGFGSRPYPGPPGQNRT